jgi:hypothetical protein
MISSVNGAVLPKTHQNEMMRHPTETRRLLLRCVTLSIRCVISYWLITHLLARFFLVSRDDDLLGGMWAVVATSFVYRDNYEESVV